MEAAGPEQTHERRLHVQPPAERQLRCGECDAPVDAVQRYCVVCGAHQSHIEDPVAAYLAAASARRRQTAAAAPTRRRGLTLGRAILVLCLPLALFVGVLAGRASNSGDGAIVSALHARSAQIAAPAPSRTPADRRPHRSAQTVKHIQTSTGSGYVNSQQGLPNQVSVP
jgi:hypothetical protein